MGYAISRNQGGRIVVSSYLTDRPDELLSTLSAVQVYQMSKTEYDTYIKAVEKRNQRRSLAVVRQKSNASKISQQDLVMNLSSEDDQSIHDIEAMIENDKWSDLMKRHNSSEWSLVSYCCKRQKEFFYDHIRNAIRRRSLELQ